MNLTNTTIDILVGKTLSKVEEDGDIIYFTTIDGEQFRSYHMQDCCEYVRIYNIDGNIDTIINSPIINAEQDYFDGPEPENYYRGDSYTWTQQTIETEKGIVRFEWLGESNGYYSEEVHFGRV